MISIPFDYAKTQGRRADLADWVREHDGIIVRDSPVSIYLGNIRSIDFVRDEDALAFRLKFGL